MSSEAVLGRESERLASMSDLVDDDIFFSGSWMTVCGQEMFPCGLASGTSLRNSPPVHPQGNTNFNGRIAFRYPGKIAHFSFSLMAFMTFSATTFGLSVGTHLKVGTQKTTCYKIST